MTTIQEIMQIGVGMPDREEFANFARDREVLFKEPPNGSLSPNFP